MGSVAHLAIATTVLAYNACVTSVLTYGLPLWYAEDGKGVQSNFKHMCRVQNFAVRWITGGFCGTPIGAMELISGIPPLRLRCNLLIAGYAACIMTLPDDHLLRKAWQADVTATRLQHFSPKRRPKNQPSDNPLTRLKSMGSINEQFLEFDVSNRRGDRIVDRFADRISYLNLDTPKKGSDNFPDWIKRFQTWIADLEASSNWLIYTDGGFWKEHKRGTYAAIVTRAGAPFTKHADWVLAASSFDAEIAALESALAWLTSHDDIIDKEDVHLLVDNKGVIQSFLHMTVRSSQATSTRINLLLLDLFERNPHIRLHISHCPSHSGIPFNEAVNRLASSMPTSNDLPWGTLRQHFLDEHMAKANKQWQALAGLPSYHGHYWLNVRRNCKPFKPGIKNKAAKHHFLDMADNAPNELARITRALTGHAPIGEYYANRRERFPDIETLCTNCAKGTTQTRAHILTTCPHYNTHLPPLQAWTSKRNNDSLFWTFLKENSTAFTFADLPLDVH